MPDGDVKIYNRVATDAYIDGGGYALAKNGAGTDLHALVNSDFRMQEANGVDVGTIESTLNFSPRL